MELKTQRNRSWANRLPNAFQYYVRAVVSHISKKLIVAVSVLWTTFPSLYGQRGLGWGPY